MGKLSKLVEFWTWKLFQICACLISARKLKASYFYMLSCKHSSRAIIARVLSKLFYNSEYHYSCCCVNPFQTGGELAKKWVTSKQLKLHVWPPNLDDFSLKLSGNILKSSWWRVHQYLRYHGNKFWQPFFCNKPFSCRKGFISIFTYWIIVLQLI